MSYYFLIWIIVPLLLAASFHLLFQYRNWYSPNLNIPIALGTVIIGIFFFPMPLCSDGCGKLVGVTVSVVFLNLLLITFVVLYLRNKRK